MHWNGSKSWTVHPTSQRWICRIIGRHSSTFLWVKPLLLPPIPKITVLNYKSPSTFIYITTNFILIRGSVLLQIGTQSMEYRLNFPWSLFWQTVLATIFPAFVIKRIQLRPVLIMANIETLHKDSNYIQDPYIWPLSTDLTSFIVTFVVILWRPFNFTFG